MARMSLTAALVVMCCAAGNWAAEQQIEVNLAREMKDVVISSSPAFPDHAVSGVFDGLRRPDGSHRPMVGELPEMWVQAEFPKPVTIGKLLLVQAGYEKWSRAKKVEIRFGDGATMQAELKDAPHEPQEIAIGRRSKSVRITVVELYRGEQTRGGWNEIEMWGPAGEMQISGDDPVNLAQEIPIKLSSSGAFGGHPEAGAFDGIASYVGTFAKPFVTNLPNSWIMAEFPKPVRVNEVLLYQGRFGEWSRAKTVVVELSDGQKIRATLQDEPEKAQVVTVGAVTQSIRVRVADIYPGPRTWGAWAEIEIIGPRSEIQSAKDPVTIESALALSSVRQKKLRMRVELMSNDGKDHALDLSARITDPSDRAITKNLSSKVRVPAGERVVAEMELPWADAKLWWPDDPELYQFEVTAREDGNAVALAKDTFGFREFWIDGRQFMLNGVPVNLRAHTQGVYFWLMHGLSDDEGTRRVISHVQAKQCNILRVGLAVSDRELAIAKFNFDMADRAGLMCIAEVGPSGSLGDTPFGDPGYWARCRKEAAEQVRRLGNHPSIVIWGGSNEMTLHDRSDVNAQRLADIQKAIESVDNTRPVNFDGDGDLKGRAAIMNWHYPFSHDRHVTVPNVWFEVAANGDSGGAYAGGTWKKDKPLMLGEVGWVRLLMIETEATYGGDSVFITPTEQFTAAERMWRMMGEAYRKSGIGYNLFFGDGGDVRNFLRTLERGHVAKANAPIAAHLTEYDTQFYAGQTVRRTLTVYNDSYRPLTGKLVSDAGTAGKTERSISLQPGTRTEEVIDFKMPASAGTFTWNWRIEADGKSLYEDQRTYAVIAPARLSVGQTLFLIDPKNTTAPLLKREGIDFRTISDGAAIASLPAGSVLLIGESALEEAAASALAGPVERFVASGGRVVCLAQSRALTNWLPLEFPLRPAQPITIGWLRAGGHPVLAGLSDQSVQFWGEDNLVAREPFAKPIAGNARVLIDAGAGDAGLEYALAMEIAHGTGTYLLTQMLLIEKAEAAPAARQLLGNLLNYATGFKPAQNAAQFVGGSNSSYGRLLKTIGASFTNDASAGVIVIDASGDVSEEAMQSVADGVRQGKTALVLGVNQHSLSKLRPLVGDAQLSPFRLAKVDNQINSNIYEGMHFVARPDFTWGLSNGDLSWKAQAGNFIYGSQLALDAAQFSIGGGELREVVKPGVVAERKLGTGRVIVVQLSAGDERNVARAKRGYSTLLTNLGVALKGRTITAVRPEDFFQLDLSNVMNRPLEDELEKDGKGGWTDQGANDLRQFPDGLVVMAGVPFQVEPLKTFRNNRALLIKAKNTPWGAESATIGVNAKSAELYFLHASAWDKEGQTTARYEIVYADGSTEMVEVVSGRDVLDWWSPARELANARVAWSGANAVHSPVSVYTMTWRNARPEKVIDAVRVLPGNGEGTLALLAISGRKAK